MIGFIYQWTDRRTGLKYIGRHEGELTDSYIGSGTKFLAEYRNRPDDFEREILVIIETSVDDLIAKEEEILRDIPNEELYHGNNRKYYNQVRNSSGYTSIDNPMKNAKVVEQMLLTREIKGTYKNPWQAMVKKYGYDAARTIRSQRKLGNRYGTGNRGKPKSEEHKAKIAANRKGGKPKVNLIETMKVFEQYGLKDGAAHLGITYAAFKSRVLLAKKILTKNES